MNQKGQKDAYEYFFVSGFAYENSNFISGVWAVFGSLIHLDVHKAILTGFEAQNRGKNAPGKDKSCEYMNKYDGYRRVIMFFALSGWRRFYQVKQIFGHSHPMFTCSLREVKSEIKRRIMRTSLAVRQFVALVRGYRCQAARSIGYKASAVRVAERLCTRCQTVGDHDVIQFREGVRWEVCRVCKQVFENGHVTDCMMDDDGSLVKVAGGVK